MVLLPALLLLWVVPLSSQTDFEKGRLRKKFYLHEPQMQISDALTACTRDYTDLVTIYDQEENAKVVVNGTHSCSWIGANGCTWSNGDPVTFIHLTRNFTEERCCGAMTTAGTWECFNCSSKMYFMCYIQGDHILIPQNKTWIEAQLYCKKNQSNLVSIRNKMENEQVKKAVNGSDSVWIGLQYNYKVVWSDGGHPDYKQDAVCFTFLPNRTCSARNLSTCAPLCYKRFIHVSEYNMSWEKALNYCNSQQKTAGLLRIQSEDDQAEVERELKRQNISEPVWVGLRQSRLFGFWIWSNGFTVGPWANWQKEPEHQTSNYCGALEKENGTFKWFDKDCRLGFRVLCEVK
ncbi:lymphocyte antigen 75-like [Cyprinus carpio]|uniref:Lymphocyte antigen 75-like n=1 Tax=Cyprinus carpio TaxID=7962 RepID=A0A8C1JP06_CYPCA|nr:lymphocyte antigen 75-like [Cyprinus carpio]